jgi:hypothetical protein
MSNLSFKLRPMALGVIALSAAVSVTAKASPPASVTTGGIPVSTTATLTTYPSTYAIEAFTSSYNSSGDMEAPGSNLIYTYVAAATLPAGNFTYTIYLEPSCSSGTSGPVPFGTAPSGSFVFTQEPTLNSTGFTGAGGTTSNITPQSGGLGYCYASFSIYVPAAGAPTGSNLVLQAVDTGGAATAGGMYTAPSGQNAVYGHSVIGGTISGGTPGLTQLNSVSTGGVFQITSLTFEVSGSQLEFTTHGDSLLVTADNGNTSSGDTSADIDIFSANSNGYTWREPEGGPGQSESYVDIGGLEIINHNYLDHTAAAPYVPYTLPNTVGTVAIATTSLSTEVNGSTGLYETWLRNTGTTAAPLTADACPTSYSGMGGSDVLGVLNGATFNYPASGANPLEFPSVLATSLVEVGGPTVGPYETGTETYQDYEVCHYGLINAGLPGVVIGDVATYKATLVSNSNVTADLWTGDSATDFIPYAYNGVVWYSNYSFADSFYGENLRIVNASQHSVSNAVCEAIGDITGTQTNTGLTNGSAPAVGYAVLFNETTPNRPSNPNPIDGGAAIESLNPGAGTLIPVTQILKDAGLYGTDGNNPYNRAHLICFTPFDVYIEQVVGTPYSINNMR